MQSKTLKKGLASLSAALVAAVLAGSLRAEGPTISGFVDMGYNYNLNGQDTNILRGFDADANSINLQNAEIVVSGTTGDRIGYRVDVDYGYDAIGVNSVDGFAPGAQINVQQAFLTFPCPLTDATFTVGKFVTPFGAEVIEAKDNYNISRGLLFNYAIPYVHTGAKWDKGFADGKYTATLGLTNGWDVVNDNNKGKTLLAQVGTTVLPKTKLILGGAYGPEQSSPEATPDPGESTSNEKNGRSLLDAIVTFTPTEKLTLIGNVDYGVEEFDSYDVPFTPTNDNTTANWMGVGIHANYALSDVFSVAARYENMDDDGSRTLVSTDGDGLVLQSGTLTLQAKKDSLIYRLEYRQDQSTEKVFVDSNGQADDTQSTIGAQVILTF